MSVLVKNSEGKIVREQMDAYICSAFLDLVEETPFYKIKVRELTEHAGISRSTFYTYFDSIYDVVQKIEDDFLISFYPEEVALAVLVGNDESLTHEQNAYVAKNSRTIRLLCGPNGDPYFMHRLEKRLRELCAVATSKTTSKLTPKQHEYLNSYIAGGTTSVIRLTAEMDEMLSEDELGEVNAAIIQANNILLGSRPIKS